jgi:hypothetical protein
MNKSICIGLVSQYVSTSKLCHWQGLGIEVIYQNRISSTEDIAVERNCTPEFLSRFRSTEEIKSNLVKSLSRREYLQPSQSAPRRVVEII